MSLEIKWDSYFSHLPPCPGPYPPQEERLGSCSSAPSGAWGGACPGGIHHVPGSSRVHVICGFSTLKETAKKWLAWLTLGPFPQIHESDQTLPKRQVSGAGRVWGVWRERQNYFPNTSKRTKVSVQHRERENNCPSPALWRDLTRTAPCYKRKTSNLQWKLEMGWGVRGGGRWGG